VNSWALLDDGLWSYLALENHVWVFAELFFCATFFCALEFGNKFRIVSRFFFALGVIMTTIAKFLPGSGAHVFA